MPQLDHVTFFSQYFWLCIFFLAFYAELYYHFLPKLARIMKTRKKQMLMSAMSSDSSLNNNTSTETSPVIDSIKESKVQLNQIMSSSAAWSSNVVIGANNKDFLNSNQIYLENLANNNVLQNTILFDLNMIASQSIAGKGPAKEKLYNCRVVQQLFV